MRAGCPSVNHLALVADAGRFRLRAVGEHVPQFGQLHVAVFFHEAGDVVATAPTAGLALDRQGRAAEVRERVGVVSQARFLAGLAKAGPSERPSAVVFEAPRGQRPAGPSK
jgi:hypothetical protein